MRAFRAVVESHGFARAAARLGVSATSVSRSVADLERALDARLLHRTTRKVRLTDEGRLYYERCTRVLDELDSAELLMKGAHEIPTGILRVAASPAFGAMALAPLLPAFHRAWPLVRLDLFLDDRVVDVIGEGYDLALRFVERRVDSSLVARKLASIESRVVASPEFVAAHGLPAHPRDLEQHAFIAWSLGSLPESLKLDGPDGRTVVPIDGPVRTDNSMVQLSLALAGAGITELPDYVVREDLARGTLVDVLPGYHTPPLGLWAVMPPAATLAARVRVFVDHVAAGLTTWRVDEP